MLLQIGKSNEDHEALLGTVLEVFSLTTGAFIILSAFLGIWYSRRTLKPVRQLASTISKIQAGNLSQRVELGEYKDELHSLGDSFNSMVERIENLVIMMRESVDNVAHDIRTPLTRIRAVAEVTLLSGDSNLYRDALEDCAESAAEVAALADQLMSISEAEAGTLKLQIENCNVCDLLKDVVEVYDFVMQEKNISAKIICDPSLSAKLDRKRVKQAIANLLDNAIKFSSPDSEVLMQGESRISEIWLSVKDKGVGVPDADLPRIWDRLYRGDKSRTSSGLGLGLSIVRSIAIAHKGTVGASPNAGAGMTFVLSIPKI